MYKEHTRAYSNYIILYILYFILAKVIFFTNQSLQISKVSILRYTRIRALLQSSKKNNTHDYNYANSFEKWREISKFRRYRDDSIFAKSINHRIIIIDLTVKADLCIVFHRAVVKRAGWYTPGDVPLACWGGLIKCKCC